jgi:hypothetical protein
MTSQRAILDFAIFLKAFLRRVALMSEVLWSYVQS